MTLIIVITFCNVCTIVNNSKPCDLSGLNGMIISEGSRMQRSERALMLRFAYVPFFTFILEKANNGALLCRWMLSEIVMKTHQPYTPHLVLPRI